MQKSNWFSTNGPPLPKQGCRHRSWHIARVLLSNELNLFWALHIEQLILSSIR